MSSTTAQLIDKDGAAVNSWSTAFRPGLAAHVDYDGNLLRAINIGASSTAGAGGGVQRHALDGTLLWDFRYDGPGFLSHHDIEPLPNGNVLLIAFEDLNANQASAVGRDPTLIRNDLFRPDYVVEIEPTGLTSGRVVWEWHVIDHVIQDYSATAPNFGVVADHPELVDINYPPIRRSSTDWNHMNGIDYDPIHDQVVVSARAQSEIWIIDHGTTTIEAAGHSGGRRGKGGDLLYRWGNPQVYQSGTAADQTLHGQHDPRFIPPGSPGAGNLTVFDNGFAANSSAVHEIVLPLDSAGNFVLGANGTYGPSGYHWSYSAPGFFSQNISGAERLPNGHTLICSGSQRWVFEVTPTGQIVWEHQATGSVFQAQYLPRSLWSSTQEISASAGGSVAFDLIAGTSHVGANYLLLASGSGTAPGLPLNGVTLPLNYDAWTDFTLTNLNTAPYLTTSFGTLGARGEGAATFTLPAGLLSVPFDIPLDFAVGVFDPATATLEFASSPAPVLIRR